MLLGRGGATYPSRESPREQLLMALGWVARPQTDPIYQEFPTAADPARPAALPKSEAHAGMRTVFIVCFVDLVLYLVQPLRP